MKARKYEADHEKEILPEERPQFHLTPRVGWANDPNGFCFYQGKYHLFYQYHPYDAYWGPMHWGHAVSEDLLHWEYLPAVMAPDSSFDNHGCFSGSSMELEDGRQLFMYTGVTNEVQPDGSTLELQCQCVAVGDGKDYEKYEKNPVLTAADLPEGLRRTDFRDPKMFRGADGTLRCVAVSCNQEYDARLLLFESEDGFCWKFKKILSYNNGRFGTMWECPDFFPLDGKQIALVSPMDMLAKGLDYHSGNATVCLIGSYDEEKEEFIEEGDQAVDYGIDFYAPQTIETPDKRRIMVSWMQNWDTTKLHKKTRSWFGQMGIPRELSLRNGRLYQWPVRELDACRFGEVVYENVTVDKKMQLSGVEGRIADLELEISPENPNQLFRKFTMNFAENESFHSSLSYDPREAVVTLDRRYSGTRRAAVHQCSCRVPGGDSLLKVRVVLDRFSAEVFINGGESVMTMTIYTDPAARGISFDADGSAVISVKKYELR